MPTRRAGGVTKRCECRSADGKRLGQSCPDLNKRSHGNFEIQQALVPGGDGGRQRFRRTGYTAVKDANSDLSRVQAIVDLADEDDLDAQQRIASLLMDVMHERRAIPEPVEVSRKLGVGVPLDGKMTVGTWLDNWLGKKKTRSTTNAAYRSHVEYHLKPRIGHLRLDKLGVDHLEDMFASIQEDAETIAAENAARREQEARCRWGKPGRPPMAIRHRLAVERERLAEMPPFRKVTGTGSLHAIRRTLRTALNAAIGRKLITFNPARYVELTAHARPTGMLWTEERVTHWRATGEVPSPVMVWTPAQLGRFLDAAEADRIYAFFHLIAHHGLRRGEGVGQEWAHVNYRAKQIAVVREIVVDGWTPVETAPKTTGSQDTVQIDSGTVTVLKEHRKRQLAERDAWNAAAAARRENGEEAVDWTDTGKVFAQPDGTWLHPEMVSDAFRRILRSTDLPPINLRDLRHGAASLIKAAGGDLHDAKVKLRHSTITLTSDTYTTLFREAEEELTEKVAGIVPRARKPADDPAVDER